ncbi:cyclic nucleotide-binding domain-containing protein [Siminovitchia terrae]|uniref:cyclic nucleotide-binding domain-containing protein n=1 Tax=Siminovitchia terrae TaxID=1914933 RepID=UPI001FD095C6|nr:cyclic nucleotide-binding domain-containing protein [Siminovitchia terrae]
MRGEEIYGAGDTSAHLYIVHQGRVKIFRLSESGKEQLIRILEPGEFMGELALFSGSPLTTTPSPWKTPSSAS